MLNNKLEKECIEVLNNKMNIDTKKYIKSLLKSNALVRITTDFNVISLEDKIKNNYLTAININLGNALEEIFKTYLIDKGVIYLNRKMIKGKDCDQLFKYEDKIFLIEQKIRDDHDSSKKIGQIENYLEKKEKLIEIYGENNVVTCSWFIDDSFLKNKKYYLTKIPLNELYYGKEIENFLYNIFNDNRCECFYTDLIKLLDDFKNNYFKILNTNNFKIDYTELTVNELYKIFINNKKDILINLFLNNFSYNQLQEYIEKDSKFLYKSNFLKIIEGECI